MISSKVALVGILIFLTFSSANPVAKEKKPRREGGRDGSCSQEECSDSRKSLKITADCIRAPFCVRQFVRDLKKTVKEKAIMERSTKQGSADIEALRDQINQADESKKKLEEKYVALSDNFEHLKQSEAALKQTNLGMEVENKALRKRNDKLEDKFKDLKSKLEIIEKQSSNILAVTAEKEEVEKSLKEMKTKHRVQERRIESIVQSLELIENQNALNSQNLANVMEENLELKSALEVVKAQNEHLKSKEEALSEEVADCQEKFVDLESVNTNCKKKIGELNVCKSEISNLSKIVEERLDQVKASKEDVTSFKGRNDLLEKDLQLAKEELDNFTSNMEKKARRIENLQSRLDNCEKEQKEMMDTSEEVKVQQECESPCTISMTEKTDLISLSELETNNQELKEENEMLSRQMENLSETLNKCKKLESEVETKEE